MKIDAELGAIDLSRTGDEARRLEGLGFDAVWTFEAGRDPFLPLVSIANATERLEFGTNVAIAFARSPFATAQAAWDLQKLSGGRLHLGLGTQVRAHVERRYSMPFDHPAARVTDYIHCLRAIWHTLQTGEKPNYRGPYYQFTLMNEMFNPGPISNPQIPVDLAGFNERMCRAAGEVADGLHVHPMHSPGYLRDVVRPAVDSGARSRGKTVDDLCLHASVFAITGETPDERLRAEATVRRQVAFYASTPGYRTLLTYHGLEDVGRKLGQLIRQGETAAVLALVPDALMEQVTVSARRADLPALLRERYDGLLQRVALYYPIPPDDPAQPWADFVAAFRRAR